MANLTRYNLMFDKSPGPTLCEMVVDHNGAWVKFADIKELLQTAHNTASAKCPMYRKCHSVDKHKGCFGAPVCYHN